MKNILKIIFLLSILTLVLYYRNNITSYIIENFIYYDNKQYLYNSNEYKLNYNFGYVKTSDTINITNKQELMNIFFTALNNGEDEFSFLCEYDGCNNDLKFLLDNDIFSFINNFVHPYNSYKQIYVSINSFNKVTITLEKSYTDTEIQQIENNLNEILPNIINNEMTNKEKIIAFHDYIINNTKYDSSYINENLSDINSPSHKATGVLFYNKALCGGYSDIMSIFLNKLNIPNFLISSEYHVWNAVYLDNSWYHLDLTWDDPVTSDNSDIRLDKFLLISDEELDKLNTGYHDYDKNIYLEFAI